MLACIVHIILETLQYWKQKGLNFTKYIQYDNNYFSSVPQTKKYCGLKADIVNHNNATDKYSNFSLISHQHDVEHVQLLLTFLHHKHTHTQTNNQTPVINIQFTSN